MPQALGLSNEEILTLLRKACLQVADEGKYGAGYSAWGRIHGIDHATISQMLSQKRPVSNAVALALGYKKITCFIPARRFT